MVLFIDRWKITMILLGQAALLVRRLRGRCCESIRKDVGFNPSSHPPPLPHPATNDKKNSEKTRKSHVRLQRRAFTINLLFLAEIRRKLQSAVAGAPPSWKKKEKPKRRGFLIVSRRILTENHKKKWKVHVRLWKKKMYENTSAKCWINEDGNERRGGTAPWNLNIEKSIDH